MARAAISVMLGTAWRSTINISMQYETMRRRGFPLYRPFEAMHEAQMMIWAQDQAGTGITVNALLLCGGHAPLWPARSFYSKAA